MSSTNNNNKKEEEAEFVSTKEQLEILWQTVIHNNDLSRNGKEEKREYPSYDELLLNLANSDYNDILTCPMDLRIPKSIKDEKLVCPFGAVCQAKIELFNLPRGRGIEPYTGLLAPGQTLQHCLIRLSTAIKPPSVEFKAKWTKALLRGVGGQKLRHAKLFPTAAIKVFRSNSLPSGNLLLAGCKVGQPELNYFAHSLSTQLTEKMPKLIKPMISKVWKYSDFPLSLGTSDFCSGTIDGIRLDDDFINFPYIIILHPTIELQQQETSSSDCKHDCFDECLDSIQNIPSGTHLFDMFCAPDPKSVADASKLQRIGKIISTSEMIPSSPGDGLFFKHQRREEDFALRPDWPLEAKTTKVSDGKNNGPVGHLAGWKLFEQQIAQQTFIDFETTT